MPDVIRTRDCNVYLKGDTHAVVVDDTLITQGWPGGQGVQWVNSSLDERKVTFSTGLWGGFLIWGSDEEGDDFTGITRNQPHYRFATMLTGSNVISTSTYERYTHASRIGGGGLVELVYTAQDVLYFSRRGLFTKEDEMTLVGDPLAPALPVGRVTASPRQNEAGALFLGVQTSI